ncbi:FAR1-related protein, partial [Striga asiatica]
ITEINRDVRVDISPGSTQYYTPLCDHDLKPFVGQEFKTLDDVFNFIRNMQLNVDLTFDVHHCQSQMMVFALGDMLCVVERMRMTWAVQRKKGVECLNVSVAKLGCKFVSSDKYIVDKFIEQHAHSLCTEMYKHFLNVSRNMDIGHQKHAQEKMNSGDEMCVPQLRRPLLFERHASNVYTLKIFEEKQNDIVAACFECRILTLVDDPDHCFYEIEDVTYGACEVVYDKSQNTATCSCKKFVRVGLLCCHVFYVFKDLNLQSIPEKYLVPRWTKYASLKPIFEVHGQIIDQCAMIEERKSIMNQLFSEFCSCIGLVEGNNDFMTSLLHSLKNQRHIFTSGVDQSSATTSKKKLFEDYYGGSVPQKVQVLPPLPIKTKGSGS